MPRWRGVPNDSVLIDDRRVRSAAALTLRHRVLSHIPRFRIELAHVVLVVAGKPNVAFSVLDQAVGPGIRNV